MNADGNSQSVKLGQALYTLRRGDLFDSDDQLVPMRAKPARMMALLISEPGRIFSRDEIAHEVWPNVVASDESISQCVSELRRSLNDHEHVVVKTYPKRGYSISAELKQAHKPFRATVSLFFSVALAFAMFSVAFIILGKVSDHRQETLQLRDKPLRNLVAVLPFQSLNSAGADNYLNTGLAEDLIIQLSQLSAVNVLPSTLSFVLANEVYSPIDVATTLNARYLVYGRIQHGKNALQVSVQLIDGHDGTRVWSDEYDVARDDLLTYQQTVLENLTKAMSVVLSERDRWLIEMPATSSKQAFEEVLKGRIAANEFTNQANLLAEKHFREAVRLDPNYARGFAELAAVYAIRFENAWSVLVEADEEKAMYFAQKAIELDAELWLAHYAIGRIYSTINESDLEAAGRHLRIAMSLQPDNDDARVYFAAVKIFTGRAKEAAAIIEDVLATHPAPPHWYYLSHGHALFHLERHEEAATALSKCLEQMRTSPYCLRVQIANYGLLGQRDDAEWAAEEYAMLGHDPTIDLIVRLLLDKHPDHIQRLREGLIAAGLE